MLSREKLINFKVSEEEKDLMIRAADKEYATLSTWIRQTLLKAAKQLQLQE